MRKFFRISALVTLLLLLQTNIAHAASLILERIGTDTVTTQTFTQWTYSGTKPSFSGSADPDAVVAIQIDDIVDTTTADETGYWSFLPFSLTYGAHDFHLSSGSESVVFTLNIATASGTTTTATPTPTKTATSSSSTTTTSTTKGGTTDYSELDELPATGSVSTTALLIIGGVGMLLAAVAARTTFAGLSDHSQSDEQSDVLSSASPQDSNALE